MIKDRAVIDHPKYRPRGNQVINYNNQHQNRFDTNYLGSNGRPRKDVTYDSSADWMLRYHNKLFQDISASNSAETDGRPKDPNKI